MSRKLMITYKPGIPSVLTEHNGSHLKDKKHGVWNRFADNNHLGLTSRSHRESFRNIKSKEAAIGILKRRNTKNILFAKYNNEVIF